MDPFTKLVGLDVFDDGLRQRVEPANGSSVSI
jgi:hypothetical protein